MPEMNGYEVCQQLKADDRTSAIPILFLSALDDVNDKVKAFTSGGVDYITKPFQAQEVLARVRTHLELQATHAELSRQIEERDQLIDELDAFAHTVAHDLKNPLANMFGYSELAISFCQEGKIEDLHNCLQTISGESDRMINIVNALLLLASVRKMETIEIRRLDTSAIVTSALQRLDYMIEEAGAEIILPEEWPDTLGHPQWVEEVWANYISNAIKYGGSPPRVELGAEILPDGKTCFWVNDNGTGISPADQASLFIPFTRLEQSNIEGHGLGLSIVQRIVEKLGGDVGVESQIGNGSVFTFTMPASLPGDREPPTAE
jgi:signal transduction histidine kinase